MGLRVKPLLLLFKRSQLRLISSDGKLGFFQRDDSCGTTHKEESSFSTPKLLLTFHHLQSHIQV